MKKIILFTACALLCAGTAFSQNYKHAIGLRAGGSNAALTYKQHLNAGNAFEVMAWFGFYEASSFSAAGLYEWTQPVINNDFNLYYGVGGHLGAAANKFAIGIDAIVGLEYKIPNAPIAFSLDYKPSVSLLPELQACHRSPCRRQQRRTHLQAAPECGKRFRSDGMVRIL